ncbi:hypothetical protein ID866_10821 [Astraeus odoratus]|nr:hypothetical protein ID866_10821 [Astraeus odoratus]
MTVSKWAINAMEYLKEHPTDHSKLLLGTARALRYLHEHPGGPFYHGSVRANNVLVAGDGSAWLTAFYCSASSYSLGEPPTCGPKRWMAPEVIEDDGKASAEGDVWAFGMTVLELFTGGLPFRDIKLPDGVMTHILRGGLPDRASSTSIPNEWWDLCTACWNCDPALRPRMSDIVNTVKGIMASQSAGPSDTGNQDLPYPTIDETAQIAPGDFSMDATQFPNYAHPSDHEPKYLVEHL